MNCKAQIALETLLVLTAYLCFLGILLQVQVEELSQFQQETVIEKTPGEEIKRVFGKSRCRESNFTRWFR